MADALFTKDDYTAAILALLPRGRAWPKDPGAVQVQVAAGLADGFVRLDARAQGLLIDAFPATTVELLPEWEQSLGLPDPCEGASQVLQQRRAQVVARFVDSGGQSVAHFLQLIAGLGYQGASIDQFAPFRADCSVSDSGVNPADWWSVWRITIPGLRVFNFTPDVSCADEPLVLIPDQALFCIINEAKPAHTTVIYVIDPPGALDFTDPNNSELLPVF